MDIGEYWWRTLVHIYLLLYIFNAFFAIIKPDLFTIFFLLEFIV